MSKQLHQAGQELLNMGYYKNQHSRSGTTNDGHEHAVAQVLGESGFTQIDRAELTGLSRSVLKEWWTNSFDDRIQEPLADQPEGSFVLQPGGTQSFPDILIRDYGGRFVALECKSTQGTCPMWNDSVPKAGAVYVLSSARADRTTLFMGEQVITAEELTVIEQYKREFDRVKAACAQKMAEAATQDRGWLFSYRPQFFQQGGAEFTNYFEHADRAACEQQTLEFLSQ